MSLSFQMLDDFVSEASVSSLGMDVDNCATSYRQAGGRQAYDKMVSLTHDDRVLQSELSPARLPRL